VITKKRNYARMKAGTRKNSYRKNSRKNISRKNISRKNLRKNISRKNSKKKWGGMRRWIRSRDKELPVAYMPEGHQKLYKGLGDTDVEKDIKALFIELYNEKNMDPSHIYRIPGGEHRLLRDVMAQIKPEPYQGVVAEATPGTGPVSGVVSPIEDKLKALGMDSNTGERRYYHEIDQQTAEIMVRNQEPGSYLIRPSASAVSGFTLTFNADADGSVTHLRLGKSHGQEVPAGMHIESYKKDNPNLTWVGIRKEN